MMQYFQNLRYNFTGPSDEIDSKLLVNATITLLGQRIGTIPCEVHYAFYFQQKRELINKIYTATIWFSYRKNFPAIPNTKITSDEGWGCMLRSGQMIWAQILRNHLREKKVRNYQPTLLLAFADDDSEEHKRLFTENVYLESISPYSILKIETVRQLTYKQRPGTWYSPDAIMMCLQKLHQIQPMRDTQDLRLVLDQNCFYEELFCEMYGLDPKCEHNTEKFNQKQKDFSKICNQCEKKPPRSIALMLNAKLGLKHSNPQYFPILLELMDMPQFQGLISGQGNRAYYIIGRIEKTLLYLDPHYVQEAVTAGNQQSSVPSYFAKGIRLMELQQLATSMSIGFYMRSKEDLDSFFGRLENLQAKYERDMFFFSLGRILPDYMVFDMSYENMIVEID